MWKWWLDMQISWERGRRAHLGALAVEYYIQAQRAATEEELLAERIQQLEAQRLLVCSTRYLLKEQA